MDFYPMVTLFLFSLELNSRENTHLSAEIMLTVLLFHNSDYRCLKHFHLEYVFHHMRHLYSKAAYNSDFRQLRREVFNVFRVSSDQTTDCGLATVLVVPSLYWTESLVIFAYSTTSVNHTYSKS